jgi:hypothetical protein
VDLVLSQFLPDDSTYVRSLDFSELSDDRPERFIAASAALRDALLVTADEKMLGRRHPLARVDAHL